MTTAKHRTWWGRGIRALAVYAMMVLPASGQSPGASVVSPEPSVTVLCYTNAPGWGLGVMLCFTNPTTATVCLVVDEIQHVGGKPDDWSPRIIGPPSSLTPGTSMRIFAPAPTTQSAWRIRLKWYKQKPIDRLWRWMPRGVRRAGGAKPLLNEYYSGTPRALTVSVAQSPPAETEENGE